METLLKPVQQCSMHENIWPTGLLLPVAVTDYIESHLVEIDLALLVTGHPRALSNSILMVLSSPNTHEMGFGFVLHDSHGNHLFSRSTTIHGLYSSDEGEAIGLFEALSLIKELDLRNVIIEMDVKLVVDAFNAENGNSCSVFGDIIDACKRSFKSYPFCKVVWVVR
ncbi:hypothetical protein ACS0TY_014006 [Phlomoides rotata]